MEQAKAGVMVHSWPGHHTHYLIFLPKNWRSWEEAFRPHYVKEKCLQGGCAECT